MGALLVATTNKAKFNEFASYLKPYGIRVASLADVGIKDAPDEDAETFEENSLIKANFYWQRSGGLPTLAEDGGLEIDALNGQPGVHSRRIDGIERSDEDLRNAIIKRLRGVPEEHRTARLRVVATLRVTQDRNFQSEASIEGTIKESALTSTPGFPYRAILWIPRYNKFYAECTEKECAAISHRRRIVEMLLPYLQQYVL